MKFFIRILLVLVFILTCTHGALLAQHVLTGNYPGTVTETPPETVTKTTKTTKQQPKPTSLLAKLGLAPFFNRERQLVAIVIENHELAREHQLGLREALLVQEWMVEGLISRFVVLLDLANLPDRVGPIRSLRPYFVDGTMPWTNVFVHAGGSPEALDKFIPGRNMHSINGLRGDYHDLFVRDDTIPAPHNFFIPGKSVLKLPTNAKPDGTKWPPYPVGRASELGEPATEIAIEFYSPVHNVKYTYQKFSQQYLRSNGLVLQHAKPSNVLILEIPITEIGEQGRLQIPVRGSGRALLFRAGHVYKGKWQKGDLRESFAFVDNDGNELIFARGQTWMTVVPKLERVEWSDGSGE